jgi:lipid-A-disaccharide synthase
MVLPKNSLLDQAKQLGVPDSLEVRIGGLAEALGQADLAIASTGTVTLECAYFGIPAVALYKTSWLTWQIAKRIITVKYGAMPNLLANEEIFPEFIQDAATPERIADAALKLMQDESRRKKIRRALGAVVASLGPPGAARRGATAILAQLVGTELDA